jgi:hypothetical protein
LRVWIDGDKVVDASQESVGVTAPGAAAPWCSQDDVDAIPDYWVTGMMWPIAVDGVTVGFTIDYDDLRWWTEAS